MFVPFNTAFRFASTVPPFVKVSVAVNVTSVSVALIVEPFSVSIFFASTLTPLPVKLPVSVLVNFSDAFTPTLPSVEVTEPLLVTVPPSSVAFCLAFTVPFCSMLEPFNVALPSVAVTVAP